jgi:hypothetical protein
MPNYISSPDRLPKIKMWSLLAIVLIVAIILYFIIFKPEKESLAGLGVFVTVVVIYIGMILMYFQKPESIEITDRGVIIRLRINPLIIPFFNIKSIRKAEANDMNGVILSSLIYSLSFGYSGMYWNKNMGDMWWYCSQRKNYIIIDTNNNTRIVITPDDPEGFMKDLPLEFRSQG